MEKNLYFIIKLARWTRVISILGYIISITLLILCLFAGYLMDWFGQLTLDFGPLNSSFNLIVYFTTAILLIFPSFYLGRYSTFLKKFIATNDEDHLEHSERYLYHFFRFMGSAILITLIAYIIFIAVMSIGYQLAY
ncbi:MAG: hypothetical protein JEZ03_15920 [Bacteroidales bacterium]|nr:hypothetical protein [Bacteroidales bacterium]